MPVQVQALAKAIVLRENHVTSQEVEDAKRDMENFGRTIESWTPLPKSDRAHYYHCSPRGNLASISRRGLRREYYGQMWGSVLKRTGEGLVFLARTTVDSAIYCRMMMSVIASRGKAVPLVDLYRVLQRDVVAEEVPGQVLVDGDIAPDLLEVYLEHRWWPLAGHARKGSATVRDALRQLDEDRRARMRAGAPGRLRSRTTRSP
jgi:hypothetical protein